MQDTIAVRGRRAAAVAVAGVIVAGLAAACAFAAPAAARLHKIDAKGLLASLALGTPLDHYEITDKLELPQTVDKPFECTNCTFDGAVLARDSIFNRTVNLRGSEFKGRVDMRGATFGGPALFSLGTTFDQPADFRLATFLDTAGFDTSDFSGEARFQLSRFRDTADFGEALLESSAGFSGAQFTKAGLFVGTTFTGPVAFDHVSGNAIDLTNATLPQKTDLESITVETLSLHRSEFDSSTRLVMNDLVATNLIMDPADTRYVNSDARGQVLDLIQSSAKARNDLGVANDAYYRIRERRGNTWGGFWHALDFVFYRWGAGYLVVPWRPLVWLVLLALIVAFWRSRRVPPRAIPERDGIPYQSPPAPPPPRKVFVRIRRTTHALGSRIAWAWLVVWRWSAPRTLVRGVRSARACLARVRKHVPARFSRWGHELLDTLALIVPRFGGPPSGRRLETFVYRVLLVCVLFGLANSNPTLRQMLDAIL